MLVVAWHNSRGLCDDFERFREVFRIYFRCITFLGFLIVAASVLVSIQYIAPGYPGE